MIEEKKSIFDGIKVDGSAHSVSMPMHVWGRLAREYNELSGEVEQLEKEIKQLNQKLSLKEFEIDQARNHKLFSIRQQLKDYEEALRFIVDESERHGSVDELYCERARETLRKYGAK